MAPEGTRSEQRLLSQRSHMAKAVPRPSRGASRHRGPPAHRSSVERGLICRTLGSLDAYLTPPWPIALRRRRLNSLRALKGEESSSMETYGKAVRVLLAIVTVTVIAACLVQPSHAAGVLMGNVRLGTRMYIDGRELLFVSPCIDIPPITGVLPADARPANDDRWADCISIRFFQDAGCAGPVLYTYDMTTSPVRSAESTSGRVTSLIPAFSFPLSTLRSAAGDVCKYARCPPNSKCDPSTYDPNQSKSTTKSNLSGYIVECPCNEGYVAARRRCQLSKPPTHRFSSIRLIVLPSSALPRLLSLNASMP
ncbi:unnamed protein product [Closterium sp. NIES-64]|nr:unnamed protein product [Closterium sp. NIES-64]